MINLDVIKNRIFPSGLVISLVILICYFGFLHYQYNRNYGIDDSYITYRYSFNFADGYGLVFNPGEKHYGSTAAGYAVLLGVISKSIVLVSDYFGSDKNGILDLRGIIPVVSRTISTISLMLSALLLTIISWQAFGVSIGSLLGLLIVVTIFLTAPANLVVGHETYFFLALWLLASFLTCFSGRYYAAAIILALATTIRPDTLLFAGVLFIVIMAGHLRSKGVEFLIRNLSRPAILFIILIGIWFSIMWIYYGQPLPETKTAKQAQVVLGHWQIFSPTVIFNYLKQYLSVSVIALLAVGSIFPLLRYIIKLYKYNKGATVDELSIGLYYFSVVWIVAAVGLMIVYTAMGVTYWLWYGIPIWFAIVCIIPGTVRLVYDTIYAISPFRKWIASLSVIVLIAGLTAYDTNAILWRHNNMQGEPNQNTHIGSYDGAISILEQVAPEGTSIAMAEPGYVGFKLGPKYQLIDLLGLASPGVSRAIIRGEMDYPFERWSPEFVISSWKGKYDPTKRAWFNDVYELYSEVIHPHWTKALGGPYQIYKKIEHDK